MTVKKIDIEIQRKKQSNWDWAAVAASISSYYGGTATERSSQSAFASWATGMQCGSNPDPRCNQPFSVEAALKRFNSIEKIEGRMTWPQIVEQINAGQPIVALCSIDRKSESLIIFGYDDITESIIGEHSFLGPMTCKLADFPISWQSDATWSLSYTTKRNSK